MPRCKHFAGTVNQPINARGSATPASTRAHEPLEILTIPTKEGEVRVEVALREGKRIKAKPEYEDCRRIAQERNMTLREVDEIMLPEALDELHNFHFKDLSFARLNTQREIRVGYPEIIYCAGKSAEQLRGNIGHPRG